MHFAAPLFGRATELHELGELLDSGERLVTLVGPPGIGKTRLALAVADQRDAVVVDLSTAVTVFEICSAAARGLGHDLELGATAARAANAVGEAIAKRGSALLVLDNFEQLVSFAAETIACWLAAAPSARFLVTSRERLGLDGERMVELSSLSLPEPGKPLDDAPSVQLLRDRAARRGSESPWAPRDEATIASIVRELDGIPLALELAASRLVALGPQELLGRLRDRFGLLRSSARDDAGRHATLLRAIESSWQMLTAAEQSALAQCSVFHGGFSMQAAEAVLEVDGAVIDLLQRLVDRSLLFVRAASDAGGAPRHRAYLSIRELAERKLEESGGAAGARLRHARHYIAVGEKLAHAFEGPDAPAARAELERERDNIVAAVRWALAAEVDTQELAFRGLLALAAYAVNVGPLREHLPLLDLGVTILGKRLSWVAQLLEARGYVRVRAGEVDGGIADLERAAEIAQKAGADRVHASALRSMGVGRIKQSRHADAARCFNRALAAARACGDRRLEGMALGSLGVVRQLLSDAEGAREALEAALEIHREVGNTKLQGVVHSNLAKLHLETGEHARAHYHYERAIELNRATGNRFAETLARGMLSLMRGDLADGIAIFSAAIPVAERAGEAQYEAVFAGYAGAAELERGDLDAAQPWLDRAIDRARAIGDRSLAGLFSSYRAAVTAERGQIDEAERAIRDAMSVVAAVQLPAVSAQLAHVDLARAAVDPANAEALSRTAAERSAALLVPGPDGRRPIDTSLDARCVLRILRARGVVAAARAPASLVVAPDGSRFRLRDRAPVDLAKHRHSARILAALVAERLRAAGSAVSPEVLAASGWPGERMRPTSAKNRLHVALSSLRKLGLEGALLTCEGGYLLDPELPVVVAQTAEIQGD